jgi:hypothetical protein
MNDGPLMRNMKKQQREKNANLSETDCGGRRIICSKKALPFRNLFIGDGMALLMLVTYTGRIMKWFLSKVEWLNLAGIDKQMIGIETVAQSSQALDCCCFVITVAVTPIERVAVDGMFEWIVPDTDCASRYCHRFFQTGRDRVDEVTTTSPGYVVVVVVVVRDSSACIDAHD